MSKPRDLLVTGGVDTPEAKSRLQAWLERVEARAGFAYDPRAEFRHAAQARDRRNAEVRFPREDHRRCWRKSGLGVLYTSQPYADAEPSPELLSQMKAACDRYGLALFTSAEMSWHCPGHTLLVVAAKPAVMSAVGIGAGGIGSVPTKPKRGPITKDGLIAEIQQLLSITDDQWRVVTACSTCGAAIGQPCTVRGREAHSTRVDRGNQGINARDLLRTYIEDMERYGDTPAATHARLRKHPFYKRALEAGYLQARS